MNSVNAENWASGQSVATQRAWYAYSQDRPTPAAATAASHQGRRRARTAPQTHMMVSALKTTYTFRTMRRNLGPLTAANMAACTKRGSPFFWMAVLTPTGSAGSSVRYLENPG